jgi:hypothetical protein
MDFLFAFIAVFSGSGFGEFSRDRGGMDRTVNGPIGVVNGPIG